MNENLTTVKRKKSVIKIIGFVCLGLVALILAYLLFALIYHVSYKVEVQAEVTNDSGYVTAFGKALYDKDGKLLEIKGVNAGNWLIWEEWLGVNYVGYTMNGDNYAYDELPMAQALTALSGNSSISDTNEDVIALRELCASNPTKYWWYEADCTAVDLLLDWYYSNWWTSVDFENVKNLGMNCIRLPFYYRTVMEGDDENLTMKDNAFKWLDYFVKGCRDNGLYCILDCHGVVGSQSGYEHSGDNTKCEFWTNQTYIEEMATMWKEIARHYLQDEQQLGKWIAAYDIINEPIAADKGKTVTQRAQWDVFDVIYDAIREVDDKHCISVEGCWDFFNLPNPAKYGWSNVIYQYHWYNITNGTISNSLFFYYKDLFLAFADYDVPVLIGEFTFFDDEKAWQDGLDLFDERHYNWTIWTYKMCIVGDWNNSWALYNIKMNSNEQTNCKYDLNTATAGELIKVWGALQTDSIGVNADWWAKKGLSETDNFAYTINTNNVYGFIAPRFE